MTYYMEPDTRELAVRAVIEAVATAWADNKVESLIAPLRRHRPRSAGIHPAEQGDDPHRRGGGQSGPGSFRPLRARLIGAYHDCPAA